MLRALYEHLSRKARERRFRAQAEAILANWKDSQSRYADRVKAEDTRGQHDAWPKLHDATNARLRAGV